MVSTKHEFRRRKIQMSYVESVLELVIRRNPGEPEFHQAAEEVLQALKPVIDRHPEYEKNRILERFVEPERVMIFRVPWVDDRNQIQVNRGFRIQFNSAIPAPAEISRVLTGLKRRGISSDMPLTITGHACELGKDQYNQALSLRRAKAVADLLLASGFTVAEVSGRGSRSPLTTDPEQYSLNRRVEISPASDKNDNSPASRGR